MRWKDGACFAVNIFGRDQWRTVASWANPVVKLRFVCAFDLLERGRCQARGKERGLLTVLVNQGGLGSVFLMLVSQVC